MIDAFSTAITIVWVLVCLAVIGICAPTAALGLATDPRTPGPRPGPALVWTWLTTATLVPLAAAVHGFNWLTALLISAAWPTTLWWRRHRGEHRIAFRQIVRSLVFHIVEPRRMLSPCPKVLTVLAASLALPLVGIVLLAAGHIDVRLPAPADFDTFWRTRQLLDGTTAWDPLASLAAVVIRIAAADALSAIRAIRLALIALTAAAAGMLMVEILGRRSEAVVAPLALVVVAPSAPLGLWAIALVVLIGAASWFRWFRTRCSQDGWHALAALVLAVAHVAPFSDRPDVLWQVNSTARYLEYGAAARQALRLARQSPDDDWVLVGPPEQQLEIDGRGHFYDLAGFVSRFHNRSGDAGFRFDLGGRRLFVLVEKQPFDVSRPAPGVQFVAAQPAVYRVPRERARLGQLARQICDEYRRTHAGTAIVYDDAELRIYRFDL